MNYVTKTTKEILDELISQDMDAKGIINPENWYDARPVTLKGIIKDVADQYPDIIWLVPVKEDEPCEPVPAAVTVSDVMYVPSDEVKELLDELITDTGESNDNCNDEEHEDGEAPEDAAGSGTEPEDDKDIIQEAADPDEAADKEAALPVQRDLTQTNRHRPGGGLKGPKSLGKYEKYRSVALSNKESQDIARSMYEEGYSTTRIAFVIRRSPQTVCNWANKLKWQDKSGGE